ncbi:MAG: tRNA-dihydrouridine synthase family protein [Acidimicrobiia bacterium]|nr:tRNA-dihydrouridine synthase family protein [Acidimicrobiia bacterium]
MALSIQNPLFLLPGSVSASPVASQTPHFRSSRLAQLTFGNGRRVDFPIVFAPMAGLSHVAFRQVVRSYLPAGAQAVLFTEMLSTRLLPKEDVGHTPQTQVAPGEQDLVPQLLGNDERLIAQSLEKLQAISPAGIDINMGCPVSKVLKHNWGVALMGDIGYAEKVVRQTRRLTTLPLSVKMRTGLTDDPEYLVDFARMLEEAGADWMTLHPRIQAHHRKGSANWSYIARVREAVRVPVVGNGDIQESSDVLRMHMETGCDGVMVARAATARPWIFWQVGEALGLPPPSGRENERAPRSPAEEGLESGRALNRFCDELEKHFLPEQQLPRLRLFLAWGHKWLFFGHYLGTRVNRCADLPAARKVIDAFFAEPKTLQPRTSLQ